MLRKGVVERRKYGRATGMHRKETRITGSLSRMNTNSDHSTLRTGTKLEHPATT